MFYKLKLEDLKPKIANKILIDIQAKHITSIEVNVKIYEKDKIGVRVPFYDKEKKHGYVLFLYKGKKAPSFLDKLIYKKDVYFYNQQLLNKDNIGLLDTITDLLENYNLKKIDDDGYDFNFDKNEEEKWKFVLSKLGKTSDNDAFIYDNHFWFFEGLL